MIIWQELYKAYQEKNCEKFKKLKEQLTEEEKKTPYFSYYESLGAKICKEEKNIKKRLYFKGKAIKCPACGSFLSKSKYNQEQLEKLGNGESVVKFVCAYCGEIFQYSRRPFKTIFSGYKVGQEIKLAGKNYRLAGAVRYKGNYQEVDGGGSLEYIEWLAYDEKGEIYYISESRAKDSWGVYEEFEISRKINFPFLVQKVDNFGIYTNKNVYKVDEYDEVEVVSVIGDLNKKYKIGEKVKLWNFDNYSLEEERGETTLERNLYESIQTIENAGNFSNFSNKKVQVNSNIDIIDVIFALGMLYICASLFVLIVFAIGVVSNVKNKFMKAFIYFIMLSLLYLITGGHCSLTSSGGTSSYYGGSSSWGGSSFGGGK